MAAPSAYEQPTLNRAWEALLAHVPTIILVWIASGVLYGLSLVVYMVISLMGVGLFASDNAGLTVATFLGYIASTPFWLL